MKSQMAKNLEQEIAQTYAKIIGQQPVGLSDTLRILSRPELRDSVRTYLNQTEIDELITAATDETNKRFL